MKGHLALLCPTSEAVPRFPQWWLCASKSWRLSWIQGLQGICFAHTDAEMTFSLQEGIFCSCKSMARWWEREIIPTHESPRMIIFSWILGGRLSVWVILSTCSMQTWTNLTFRQQLTEFKPGRGHPWREGDLTKVSSRRDPFLLVLQFDRKLFPQPFVWSDSIQCFTNQAQGGGWFDSSHN